MGTKRLAASEYLVLVVMIRKISPPNIDMLQVCQALKKADVEIFSGM